MLCLGELVGSWMSGLIRFRDEDTVLRRVAKLGRVHVLGQSIGEL